MRKKDGFEVLDRDCIEVQGEKIELCDLRMNDTIYSVKRGNSSAELSYVVTQSETAITFYNNHKNQQPPKGIAIWLILSRKNQLIINNERLDWESLKMLLFKIRVDSWKKKVYLAGKKPLIRINYEIE